MNNKITTLGHHNNSKISTTLGHQDNSTSQHQDYARWVHALVDFSHDLILNLKPAKVFHSLISLGTEFRDFVALTENKDMPNSVGLCCTTQLLLFFFLSFSEPSDTN